MTSKKAVKQENHTDSQYMSSMRYHSSQKQTKIGFLIRKDDV